MLQSAKNWVIHSEQKSYKYVKTDMTKVHETLVHANLPLIFRLLFVLATEHTLLRMF